VHLDIGGMIILTNKVFFVVKVQFLVTWLLKEEIATIIEIIELHREW